MSHTWVAFPEFIITRHMAVDRLRGIAHSMTRFWLLVILLKGLLSPVFLRELPVSSRLPNSLSSSCKNWPSPRQVPPGQLRVKHQLPIYSLLFLLFVHRDRYHQVNSVLNTNYLFTHYYYYSFFLFTQTGTTYSVLNTNYLFTHSSYSSFFFFTQTGTTRSTRC